MAKAPTWLLAMIAVIRSKTPRFAHEKLENNEGCENLEEEETNENVMKEVEARERERKDECSE